MTKQFDMMFEKGSVSRECIWVKNIGGVDDRVEVTIYWKYYGGTLSVKDDNDFDIETVSLNKNSEWQKYEFDEGEDFYDIEVNVDSQNDEYQDIYDPDELEERLSEEGYESISDKMVFEECELEITPL